MPKTNQLMVVDTAGTMKAIGQMIEAIPEPKPPAKPAAPKPKPAPPAPVFQVHAVKNTDLTIAKDVLAQLVPQCEGWWLMKPRSSSTCRPYRPTRKQ